MEPLSFDIRHADGRIERTTTTAPRVAIGSGAHCDVRLSTDQASFEHVILESDAKGTSIRSASPATAATIDGAPLTHAMLPGSCTVRLGGTEIRITRAVAKASTEPRVVSAAALGKLAVVAALVVAIFVVSRWKPAPEVGAAPEMPTVFGGVVETCPRGDAAEARVVAEDQRAAADGARERSPFDPREARSAVRGYETAAACFRVANDLKASEDATSSARQLREATELDFRARRIRLERMLLVGDLEVASQDVAVLRALSEGDEQTAYARWLESVARALRNEQSASTQ